MYAAADTVGYWYLARVPAPALAALRVVAWTATLCYSETPTVARAASREGELRTAQFSRLPACWLCHVRAAVAAAGAAAAATDKN
jgi:hypothetical protein